MKSLLVLALTTAITASGLFVYAPTAAEVIPLVSSKRVRVKKTMKAFKSEREMAAYFRRLDDIHRRRQYAQQSVDNAMSVMVTSAEERLESVTNVQHAGVDEGGIVKVHGDHLVILRP